jgi:hypothetical protein
VQSGQPLLQTHKQPLSGPTSSPCNTMDCHDSSSSSSSSSLLHHSRRPPQWEDALNSFKSKLAQGEDVFGPLIKWVPHPRGLTAV